MARRKSANRVALVTGGVRRVGLAIARAIAAEGATVLVTYHGSTKKTVDQALASLRSAGAEEAKAYRCDLSDREEIADFLSTLDEKHPRIDYLINSAANFISKPLFDTTERDYDATFDLNVRAPFLLSQSIAARMKRDGFGRIVNIADIAGIVPWSGYVAYSISKGAVIAMTKALAKALAPEVLVNAVAPGPVLPPDDFTPVEMQNAVEPTLLKRVGSPEEVANAVLFLLRSDYITGVTLPVDGGRLLR